MFTGGTSQMPSIPPKAEHLSALISAHLLPIWQETVFPMLNSNPSFEQEKTKNIASKRFAAKTKIVEFFMLHLTH
jgi:hypothetical protein